MKHILPPMAAFIALAGVVVLLFGAAEDRIQPQQTSPYVASEACAVYESVENSLPSPSPPLAADGSRSDISVLDDNLDNDGHPDGMAEPLATLALVLVMLSIILLLSPSVGDRLLLAFYEPPKLTSV